MRYTVLVWADLVCLTRTPIPQRRNKKMSCGTYVTPNIDIRYTWIYICSRVFVVRHHSPPPQMTNENSNSHTGTIIAEIKWMMAFTLMERAAYCGAISNFRHNSSSPAIESKNFRSENYSSLDSWTLFTFPFRFLSALPEYSYQYAGYDDAQ